MLSSPMRWIPRDLHRTSSNQPASLTPTGWSGEVEMVVSGFWGWVWVLAAVAASLP